MRYTIVECKRPPKRDHRPMKCNTLDATVDLIDKWIVIMRKWVAAFCDLQLRHPPRTGASVVVESLMSQLQRVRSSGPYNRDQMNER